MSLKDKAIQGVKWTTISSVVLIVFQLLQLIILGRLLDSYQYGLMGMILVVIGFAEIFIDMGISNAIIHNQKINSKELSSLYWLNIFMGIIIAFLIFITSPFISKLFREEALIDLLKLIAWIFIIIPFGQQYKVLLQKTLKFNILAKIEVFSSMIGLGLSILLAYIGKGVYALIWGQIISALLRTILFAFYGWELNRVTLHFRWDEIKKFINFGIYQAAESTLNYFNTKLDTIVIGRLLGSRDLGYYTMAFNIIIIPSSKINPIITRVAFPLFSKIQNQIGYLKTNYFKLLKIVSLVNFPFFFGLAITAPILIPLVLGEKWVPSVILIQILCGVGLLRSIGNTTGSLLMAVGKVKLSFNFNAIKMVTQIPGIILGALYGGILGVAVTYLGLQIIYFLFSYFYLIRKIFGSCFIEYLKIFSPVLISCLIMSLFVWPIPAFFNNSSSVIILIVQIFVGMLIYFVSIMFIDKKTCSEIFGLLISKRKVQEIS